MATPCPACGDTAILDWEDDAVTPRPWCPAGRRAGPLLDADQRKETDKADRADELG